VAQGSVFSCPASHFTSEQGCLLGMCNLPSAAAALMPCNRTLWQAAKPCSLIGAWGAQHACSS
jgi:hypothetical protein